MTKLRSAKIIKWMSVIMAILSLSLIAMSTLSYFIDHDGIIAPFTTVMLLASLFSFIVGIAFTVKATRKAK